MSVALPEFDGRIITVPVSFKDEVASAAHGRNGKKDVRLQRNLPRLDTGGIPSSRRSLAEAMGPDYTSLLDEPSLSAPDPIPAPLAVYDDTPVRTQGGLLERLELLSRTAYVLLDAGRFQSQDISGTVPQLLGTSDAQASRVLNYVTDTLHSARLKTTDEIGNLLRGLNGHLVPAGPSGATTRGMSNILPTAWDMGVALEGELPMHRGIVDNRPCIKEAGHGSVALELGLNDALPIRYKQ